MKRVEIPSCIDFMSIYGFECNVNDCVQNMVYKLDDFCLNISFDLSVDSLRIMLFYKQQVVFDFYSENMSSVVTDDDGKYLSFVVESGKINISFFPCISLNFYDF